MSPTGQRVELEGIALDEALRIEFLAAALSLVFETTVMPEALERLAFDQSINAV